MTLFDRKEIWFIALLGTIYMFNFVDRTIVSVLGEAIRSDLGLSDLQLGLMGGLAFSFFYVAVGIPLARVADQRNRVLLISAVTAAWSVMTMLTGAVSSFGQLLLVRMGVGIGEAGFTPALMSLISDRFAPTKRATAFSLIAVGVSVGGALAALGGGWLAESLGWRMTFVLVGAPGVLLALVLALTIREPARNAGPGTQSAPPFSYVIGRLAKSRAFISLTVGSGLVAMVGFGLQLFLIPMVVRRFGFDLREAGLMLALSFSLSTGLGALLGGRLIDRIVQADLRWYCRAPALAVGCAIPLYVLALWQHDWHWLGVLMFGAMVSLYAFLPAIMTATQRLVEPGMRASAAAIHAFGQTVFGLGLGSVMLGWSSDRWADHYYAGSYESDCLMAAARSLRCIAASGSGVQMALLSLSGALVAAVVAYSAGAGSIREEILAFEPRDSDRNIL